MYLKLSRSAYIYSEEELGVAKISLICEQCGGNIILDDSQE